MWAGAVGRASPWPPRWAIAHKHPPTPPPPSSPPSPLPLSRSPGTVQKWPPSSADPGERETMISGNRNIRERETVLRRTHLGETAAKRRGDGEAAGALRGRRTSDCSQSGSLADQTAGRAVVGEELATRAWSRSPPLRSPLRRGPVRVCAPPGASQEPPMPLSA